MDKDRQEGDFLKEIKSLDSKEFFQALFEYAPDPYYITDLEGNFIDGNKAAQRITGYQKEELVGKNFFQLNILPSHEILKAQQTLAETQQGISTGPDEFTLNRKDHKKIAVEIFTYPLKIKDKHLILAIARDITKRNKIVESLRKSEERFRVALKNSPITVWSQNKDLRYNWIYPNSIFKPEDVLGRKDEDLFPVDEARVLTEIKQQALNSGMGSIGEVRMTIKGIPLSYQLVTEPLRDAQGNIIGITCATIDISELRQSQEKIQKTIDATIETVSKIAETRDPYTSGHQQRVCQLSILIAREMHLSQEQVEAIRIAALIHDIGKMAIPSEILTKPGKLSEIEFDLIKEHPKTGYEILKDIDFPYPIAQIVRQHHERMNGSGYPQGLKGENILLEAKVIGVADVIEAMSSHRPYRASLGIEAALEEITKNKGILYDSEVVDICIKLFQEKGFKFE